LPTPHVRRGKWFKERDRTKTGRWRKKRSDAGKPRRKKHSLFAYIFMLIFILILVVLIIYLIPPELLPFPKPFHIALGA